MKKRAGKACWIVGCIAVLWIGAGCRSVLVPISPTVTPDHSETAADFQVVPTPTISPPIPTTTSTKSPYPSQLPIITGVDIPQVILDRAHIAGFSPEQVVYLFNLVQIVARDRDPYPLLDFIQFPLHVARGCPGDVIETQEEFIERFPELLREDLREALLMEKLEDTFLNYRGAAFGGMIWFSWFGNRIMIARFFDYITYWEVVKGSEWFTGATPEPTYESSRFSFGKYKAHKLFNYTGNEPPELDENLVPWKTFSITITKNTLTMEPSSQSSKYTVQYTKIEFCPPRGHAWSLYGYGYHWPSILVYREDEPLFEFYLPEDDMLARFLSVYPHVEPSESRLIFFKLSEIDLNT